MACTRRAPGLVYVYMCILAFMCCESVADSRPVYNQYRERKPTVGDVDGIDDGPATFTMQDHFNFLKERELAIRAQAAVKRTHQAVMLGTARVSAEPDQKLDFDDYSCTTSNRHNDPSLPCPPG